MRSIGEALALFIIGIPAFFLFIGAMTWIWNQFGWAILFYSPIFIMLTVWFFQDRKKKKEFYYGN